MSAEHPDGTVLGTETVEDRTYEVYVDSTLAQNLGPTDKLLDGTLITRVFIGLRGVRVTGVRDGRTVRRLYRDINQRVQIEEWRFITRRD